MNTTAPASGDVRMCPYSRETVAGCRFYRPRSEHGSGPDAADCAHSITTESGYLRTVFCGRRPFERD